MLCSDYLISLGTVENCSQKWQKTRQLFEKKNTKKTWQNRGTDTTFNLVLVSEDHCTVYKTQHLALTTIITYSARFSPVKFCRCSVLKGTEYLTGSRSNIL